MDPHSPWSHLCRDMLHYEIADRLHSHIDRLCLRAVCRSWRPPLPPPPRSPPRRLPFPMGPSPHLNLSRSGFLELVHSTIYCLQPLKNPTHTSKCCLIRIDETEEPGKVRLKDPLSRFDSKNLSPPLPKTLNLLDYRVSEITKVYDLQFVGNIKINETDYPERFTLTAEKVAVCSEGPAFAVIAIHSCRRLSIWKEGDPEWTPIGYTANGAKYSDVAYCKGKFYARDSSGATIVVDILSKKITAQISPAMGYVLGDKRLLSYLGDLFLLDGDLDPERWSPPSLRSVSNPLPTKFHVHKLNDEDELMYTLFRETTLENTAIFVGENYSFRVSAEQLGGGCRKNCIYYIERFFPLSIESPPGSRTALFDMEDSSARFLSQVDRWLFWPFLASPILACHLR